MADNFTSVLEVRNLAKAYGKKEVVKDISFSMQSGQIIGLLGPNGAGKTTTFYMIVGFLKAKTGTILLNGEDITELPMYQRSKRGLSYLPQEPSIFRKLSVEDNIRLVAQTRRDLTKSQQEDRVEELLVEFGIENVRKQKGYTLSGGERRRTEIARALASNPQFLLLDEPFAGIDPKAVYEIKVLIRILAGRGIGVLLTDHNVRDTLSITSCSYIINAGTILVSGGRDELLSNQIARDIYFGQEFGEES
ncbi:MAG: LPS export ABC transporter ATP-binding protein [Sphaerochaeta sp.]|jgi:lipopolysaccharide export system ATP-binding protein|uniref:LPS export ABC transporter ATP-binding protein n=1 Tax=unclassified Sphaerochaeta TaxID=2637943 RepID=UPI0025D30AF8|nr:MULTISPECIES: LPS export ABC transporter ATP-binding protein [unclassified Sphaerochaeta]MCK9600169.1 LPS export ABC transporter ATP-binding protein [Sphaerochaeta sp.]MDD3523712.1 LPS export ABC transporter ATP-binding protein [Candidatus Cloacimonadota bacterium]MDX9823801.1 LPS export ABC transporter ATP-binding protein [Sphaerochaeta sp.]HPE92912.1 LPS export ABC transporter ATP-binding protein [Sphaerochaeta sp.]